MCRIIALILFLVSAAVAPLSVGAGTLVVANKSEATVSLVDTGSGEIRATLPTGNAPHEVAVSPNGRLALVGNYGTRDEPGSSLTVIDVGTAEVVKTINLGDCTHPHGIVWLSDEVALVTAEDQQALLRVNIEIGEIEQKISTDGEISHMVSVGQKSRPRVRGQHRFGIGDRSSISPSGFGGECFHRRGRGGNCGDPGRAAGVGHQSGRKHRQRVECHGS